MGEMQMGDLARNSPGPAKFLTMAAVWFGYKFREIDSGWMGHLLDILSIMFRLLLLPLPEMAVKKYMLK
jgi:hypothetical protein